MRLVDVAMTPTHSHGGIASAILPELNLPHGSGVGMRRDQITDELTQLAFEFFYGFSRFEFCLKENGFLGNDKPGNAAEPGWIAFVERYSGTYTLSPEAGDLLAAPPSKQVVGESRALEWRGLRFGEGESDLAKVVRVVKTVRNNLFHGGKHGDAGWDNPERTRALITNSQAVLGTLVELGDFQEDYERRY